MPEADAGRGPYAGPVRPAMRERVGHCTDPRGVHGLGDERVEDAGDAAHGASATRGAVGADPGKQLTGETGYGLHAGRLVRLTGKDE